MPRSRPGATVTGISSSDAATRERTSSGVVYDGDDDEIRFYGHQGDRVDGHAITSLVMRYYATAARSDGGEACRLLHPLLIEATVEGDAEAPGARHRPCSVIVSEVFRRRHRQLATDSTKLQVLGIRVGAITALVLLRFAGAEYPEYLSVRRYRRAWRLWDLLATHMP